MRDQLTIEAYREEVVSLVAGPLPAERVPLVEAVGRVLAEAVTAAGPIPAFANSAMDGFAVRLADRRVGARLHVAGTVVAGEAHDPHLIPGQCVRIMTGAPLPTTAEAVVPVELVRESGGEIEIVEESGKTHVREAGEDVAAGAEVLPAGAMLTPAAMSLVAASGRPQVVATRRPRVAVVATGDELRPPGSRLARGQIFESNGTFLMAQLTRLGCEVTASVVLPDEPQAFRAGLDEAAAAADLVVLSGGASVGDHDIVRQVLTGELAPLDGVRARFVHVIMQPGKPQGWALWPVSGREVPMLALPGNPLSTLVSCELFVEPVVDALLGRASRPWGRAVVGESWPIPRGRRQVVPVLAATNQDGRLVVTQAHARGSASHLVTAAANANGLAMLDGPSEHVVPGQVVAYRRFA